MIKYCSSSHFIWGIRQASLLPCTLIYPPSCSNSAQRSIHTSVTCGVPLCSLFSLIHGVYSPLTSQCPTSAWQILSHLSECRCFFFLPRLLFLTIKQPSFHTSCEPFVSISTVLVVLFVFCLFICLLLPVKPLSPFRQELSFWWFLLTLTEWTQRLTQIASRGHFSESGCPVKSP